MVSFTDLGIYKPHFRESNNHLKEFITHHGVSNSRFFFLFLSVFRDIGRDECAVNSRLVAAEGIFFYFALHNKVAEVYQPNTRIRADCDQIYKNFLQQVCLFQYNLAAHFKLKFRLKRAYIFWIFHEFFNFPILLVAHNHCFCGLHRVSTPLFKN